MCTQIAWITGSKALTLHLNPSIYFFFIFFSSKPKYNSLRCFNFSYYCAHNHLILDISLHVTLLSLFSTMATKHRLAVTFHEIKHGMSPAHWIILQQHCSQMLSQMKQCTSFFLESLVNKGHNISYKPDAKCSTPLHVSAMRSLTLFSCEHRARSRPVCILLYFPVIGLVIVLDTCVGKPWAELDYFLHKPCCQLQYFYSMFTRL